MISGVKRKMNVPEGFKQTEVGVIPQDWEVAELWQLADFLDGQRKPIKSSDREKMKGIYPYYGASGIIDYVNNYIFDDELILLGEDGENILSRNLRLAFIVRGKVWVNNHAHVLKAKEGFSIAFLAEKLESLNYEQYNSGTAQPKITKGTCAKIKISLPPTRAEQTAIAAALSDMDALIEGVEKLLEKKRRIKQGAMQELLTGKRRVSGFESQAGFQQTEVGVIPQDWEVKLLGELFEITSSKRVFQSEWKNSGIPFYRARELAVLGEKGSVDNKLFITKEQYELFKKQHGVPKVRDMLVTGVGTLGKVYVVTDEREFYFKDGNIIWFKTNKSIDPALLKQLYLTKVITKQIDDASGKTTVGTYTITGAKNTVIPLPPPAEQSAIAAILSDMDAEIEQLETQLTKYRQLKTGMMQELLTGKKRLV
jgi:type I restriction enzyme S subunit